MRREHETCGIRWSLVLDQYCEYGISPATSYVHIASDNCIWRSQLMLCDNCWAVSQGRKLLGLGYTFLNSKNRLDKSDRATELWYSMCLFNVLLKDL